MEADDTDTDEEWAKALETVDDGGGCMEVAEVLAELRSEEPTS
jgi:hypothetical protein